MGCLHVCGRTDYGKRSFAVNGPVVWNSLPAELRSPDISLDIFTARLKTFLFNCWLSAFGVFILILHSTNVLNNNNNYNNNVTCYLLCHSWTLELNRTCPYNVCQSFGRRGRMSTEVWRNFGRIFLCYDKFLSTRWTHSNFTKIQRCNCIKYIKSCDALSYSALQRLMLHSSTE